MLFSFLLKETKTNTMCFVNKKIIIPFSFEFLNNWY